MLRANGKRKAKIKRTVLFNPFVVSLSNHERVESRMNNAAT